MIPREAIVERCTQETRVTVAVRLDGGGAARVATGIGFLDHMLAQVARHGRIDLTLSCEGDLMVDDHHTVEDCALTLGQAIDRALGDRAGIRRFGAAYAPLDEALVRAVVDLSGRPHAEIHVPLTRQSIGTLACENVAHFFRSLATAARASLHVDLIRGENDHHKIEAAFKSLALALREALSRDGDGVPSTKGTLT